MKNSILHIKKPSKGLLKLVRKIQAAQYVASHDGEVCPAKWQPGEETLAPSIDLVGKI